MRGTLSCTSGALPHVVVVHLSGRHEQAVPFADGTRSCFAVDGRFEITGVEPGPCAMYATSERSEGSPVTGSVLLQVPADGVVEAALTLAPRQ